MNLTHIHNRQKKLRSDGTALVQLRINYLRDTRYVSTGIYVTPEQWSGKVVRHRHALKLNQILRKQIEHIESYYFDLRASGEYISAKRLAEYARDGGGGDVLSFVQEEIDRRRLSLSYAKQHRLLAGYLEKYGNKASLSWQAVSYRWVRGFEKFLLSQRSSRDGEPLSRNYVNQLLRLLRVHCKEALRQKFLREDPFAAVRLTDEKTTPVFLTWDEIRSFETVNVETASLRQQQIFFAWRCRTGLRWGDARLLRGKHFVDTADGLRLRYQPQKTKKYGTWVDAPLWLLWGADEMIRPLLRRGNDLIFPLVPADNNWHNQKIRDIAEKARIGKHISTHTARHTCNILLEKAGVPASLRKVILGQKSESTNETYVRRGGVIDAGELGRYFGGRV